MRILTGTNYFNKLVMLLELFQNVEAATLTSSKYVIRFRIHRQLQTESMTMEYSMYIRSQIIVRNYTLFNRSTLQKIKSKRNSN